MDRFKQQRRRLQKETDTLLPPDKRRCLACEVVKEITDFRLKPDGTRIKTCDHCRPILTAKMKRHRVKHLDKERQRGRDFNARIRNEVIAAYGGKCACCGESRREFLALDHVEGGGLKHRRDNGWTASRQVYYWARRNGYPNTLRVLCDNCNMSRGRYGYCPHERERAQKAVDAVANARLDAMDMLCNAIPVSPEVEARVKRVFAMIPQAIIN